MDRDHFWLTDAQFAKIVPHLPTTTRGKPRVDTCAAQPAPSIVSSRERVLTSMTRRTRRNAISCRSPRLGRNP